MPVARHRFFRFRTRLASGRRLAASLCPPAWWVGMLYCWLVHSPARFPCWLWCFRPLWRSPHFLCGVHCGLLALWLGWRRRRCGCVARRHAASQAWPSDTGGGPGRLPGPADRGASARTVVCAGSVPGSGCGAGRPGDDGSVGRTAGPAGGAWSRWDADSACAVVCRSSGAAVLGVAGTCRF